MSSRTALVFLCALLLILGCPKSSEQPAPTAVPPAATGSVIGGTVGFLPPGANATLILLHDFEVELRSGDAPVAKARTDEFGRYIFTGAPQGTHKLCWNQPGWQGGCAPDDVKIGDGSLRLAPIEVKPDPAAGGYAWGSVTFSDGSAATYSDALFDVDQYATVSADGGPTARVNVNGEYVLTGIPAAAKSLTAKFEAASASQPAEGAAAGKSVSIRIENRDPKTPVLAATPKALSFDVGDVLSAAPGETITISAGATDAESDALTYRWFAAAGEIIGQPAATAQWKAPDKPGVYSIDVLTGDGKGGYDRKSIRVIVEPQTEAKAFTATSALAGASCPNLTPYFPCPPAAPKGCPKDTWLKFKSNSITAAQDYYDKGVDVNKKRRTLKEWYVVAGFNPDGSIPAGANGTRAPYTNDNDLGFGRDMYMIKSNFGVFAYVANYLNSCTLQDPKNAKLAAEKDPSSLVATVCMEYSSQSYDGSGSPGGTDRIVKFFVYNAAGDIQTQALLDTGNAQPIPGICLNCHGGNDYSSSSPATVDLKARFLPFDLETYQYFPVGTIPYADFHTLNNLVKSTFTGTAPTVDLINGWYAHGGDKPDLTWVPPGDWSATPQRQKLYQRVVARSCRTCHVAFDGSGGPTWATWAEFSGSKSIIKSFVGSAKMPHAFITYTNFWSKNFWTDGTGPAVLKCFTDTANEAAMNTCLNAIP